LWEHTSRLDKKSFTARYNLCQLVYYEGFDSIVEAIAREKIIKRKTRKWKEALIEQMNPKWDDLSGLAASL
jgi:putative endonuclease